MQVIHSQNFSTQQKDDFPVFIVWFVSEVCSKSLE